MKQCTSCQEWKIPQNFAKSSSIKTGIRSTCKACVAADKREWVKTHHASVNRTKRLQHLKEYGLTPETFNTILLCQNGLCAICDKPQKETARLCIDHDHKTGRVRGLLCRHCNAILGMIEKQPNMLTQITAYLEYNFPTSTRQQLAENIV